MRKTQFLSMLVLSIAIFAQTAIAQTLNRNEIWFGVEYTFQDIEMVNEPGRSTMSTPHKEAKALEVANRIRENLGLPQEALYIKTTWKPGYFLNVPGDGQWVINSEPVTIEINTTPRTLDQIRETAAPIFAATKAAGLVAHVNPAAERSGMGHIHIGAASMAQNPFFQNPPLLRNVMVYLHKNPALLHGFAEAYDIGMNSNIETYHEKSRQEKFQKAVAQFDHWYEKANEGERKNGFNKFLEFLQINAVGGKNPGFFEHYRFINLEHVQNFPYTAESKGKITVEFRNFRPPKTPETAEAFASLLYAVMEKQAKADHVEKFEWISEADYLRFNTGTKVAENWLKVRSELGLANPILEAEVKEYVRAVQNHSYPIAIKGAQLFRAYSQKTNKGKFFELRLPVSMYPTQPVVEIDNKPVDFEKIRVGKTSYWVAVVDTISLKIKPEDLTSEKAQVVLKSAFGMCRDLLGRAG